MFPENNEVRGWNRALVWSRQLRRFDIDIINGILPCCNDDLE
jgi:hypothetical protein